MDESVYSLPCREGGGTGLGWACVLAPVLAMAVAAVTAMAAAAVAAFAYRVTF